MGSEQGKKTTIKGEYLDTKAGPMVNGVLLIDQDYNEQYRGKVVEVTGLLIENDTSLTVKPYKPGEPISQGYESPITVMRNVSSIKVVK